MNTVRSTDGTTIAYTRAGQGPALILVDGALCSRSFGPMPKLAAQLTPHFTVYTYDRRGRGASGDTPPYAVGREVDDIEALVELAGDGETVLVHGTSSGAALALEAAKRIPAIASGEKFADSAFSISVWRNTPPWPAPVIASRTPEANFATNTPTIA